MSDLLEFIRNHPLYEEHAMALKEAEKTRIFCCHGMDHLLDVARIAWIHVLEENLGFSKEMIYAAAILHDIGKDEQYNRGIPHEIASAEIAEAILADAFRQKAGALSKEEEEMILRAIREHRKLAEDTSELGRLLYRSDKESRSCFACSAEPECNWSPDKKNMGIKI